MANIRISQLPTAPTAITGSELVPIVQNGQTVQMRILDPKGEGDNPMTDADLEQKFLVNCTPLIDAVRGQRLLEAIWNFDQMRDSQELFDWPQP